MLHVRPIIYCSIPFFSLLCRIIIVRLRLRYERSFDPIVMDAQSVKLFLFGGYMTVWRRLCSTIAFELEASHFDRNIWSKIKLLPGICDCGICYFRCQCSTPVTVKTITRNYYFWIFFTVTCLLSAHCVEIKKYRPNHFTTSSQRLNGFCCVVSSDGVFLDKFLISGHSQLVWLLQNKRNVNRLKFSLISVFADLNEDILFPKIHH